MANRKDSDDGSLKSEGSVEYRLARAFGHVASTAERVGIPVSTFAAGVITLALGTYKAVPIATWLGASLVLAALGTYVWLTSRSTLRVQLPPPPIPTELQLQLQWMREQVEKQNDWARTTIQSVLVLEPAAAALKDTQQTSSQAPNSEGPPSSTK